MFERNKKYATTLIELLILLAIVGILSVIYQKNVKRDNLGIKYAYKSLLQNIVGYAATQTEAYQKPLKDNICLNIYHMLNVVGEMNCSASSIPNAPNFTTVNGMRFFGLESAFSPAAEDSSTKFKMVSVDLDGIGGPNQEDKDILTFEIMQDGHIRPAGQSVIVDGKRSTLKGNAARDPEMFSTSAVYVPIDATDKADYRNMGNRLSYTEAQCLTGNPFPYRGKDNGKLQMCVEDNTIRAELNNPTANYNNKIFAYWKDIRTGDICDELYTNEKSATYGLVSVNAEVKELCKRCYKLAYKEKFCKNVVVATINCPESVISEQGSCITADYVEP